MHDFGSLLSSFLSANSRGTITFIRYFTFLLTFNRPVCSRLDRPCQGRLRGLGSHAGEDRAPAPSHNLIGVSRHVRSKVHALPPFESLFTFILGFRRLDASLYRHTNN